MLVFEKIIVGISAAPVAVTKQDVTGVLFQRQDGGRVKGVGNTRWNAHSYPSFDIVRLNMFSQEMAQAVVWDLLPWLYPVFLFGLPGWCPRYLRSRKQRRNITGR